MPGLLLHSPADIIRRVLIALGAGLDPPSTPWPVYASNEPSIPDAIITVYDTEGVGGGRTMFDGERQEHHGIQVRVRSATYTEGYNKALEVSRLLDESVYDDTVTIDGANYLVHSVSLAGEVIHLGKQTPESKRDLFTVNALATVRMV